MKDVLVPEGFYTTVEDFAYNKGISPATVRRQCVAGSLPSVKVGKAWLVKVERKIPLSPRLDNHYGYCTLPPDHDGPCAEAVCMIPACGCSGEAHP